MSETEPFIPLDITGRLLENVADALRVVRSVNPEIPEGKLLHVPRLYRVVLYGDLTSYGEVYAEGDLEVY